MNNRARHKQLSGHTLLELIAVVTLLGLFSSAAFMRIGRDIFGDTGARSQARIVSLAMLQAQRAAIRTGDSHGLILNGSTSSVSSWTIVQQLQDSSTSIVDGPHAFPEELTVSANRSDMWFDFEGNGNQRFELTFFGPNRSYQLTVQPMTRMIRSEEVTP